MTRPRQRSDIKCDDRQIYIKGAHLHFCGGSCASVQLQLVTTRESVCVCVCVFQERLISPHRWVRSDKWLCASIKYPALWSLRLERRCSPFHSQCGSPLSFGSNQRSSPCIRLTWSLRAHSSSETQRSDSWLNCTPVSYAFPSFPHPSRKKD